ncbi:sensor histidine kinase [Sphingomonas sp. RS2018]
MTRPVDDRPIDRVRDDLISTGAHELRAPLASIVGSLGLLRAGVAGPVPPGVNRLVAIAENNSRRLIRLVNDMLDIDDDSPSAMQMMCQPIDLRHVIQDACVGSEGLAQTRSISIDCALPDHSVMVSGDTGRLLQVVTNLTSNAIRAAPLGSSIGISLMRHGQSTAIVSVDDRGAGVPEAFRDRIFGRFERADRDDASGLGIGLSISREIMDRHGGRLWLEDRDGGGTSFRFALATLERAVS